MSESTPKPNLRLGNQDPLLSIEKKYIRPIEVKLPMLVNMIPWIGLSNFVWIMAFLVSIPFLIWTPMIFDAPGSEKAIPTWMLFCSLISFPISCLVSVIGSWVVWIFKKKAAILFFVFLPLMSIFFIGLSFFVSEIICDGSFACRE